uniref:Uncharacterized protein n=1 Tax=Amphimedon queenslandica TaxID=400682 RepID=A0A1X7VQ87_AMPQE
MKLHRMMVVYFIHIITYI